MRQLLADRRELLSDHLKSFFANKRAHWSRLNEWGRDSLDRLERSVLRGKMVRGSLVLWAAQAYGAAPEDALPAAAAMELLQAALLVHDDVMDEDDVRRGLPSMHAQYRSLGSRRGLARPDHFGLSMAVCVGDLALFLAHEFLAKAGDASLVSLFCERSSVVGLGQMQDVFWGMGEELPSQEAILSMYAHKTSNYTFCLPLLLGARLAGAPAPDLEALDDLGLALGKLFQLRDDELGLYGGDSLGKSVGLDLVSGKKTLHYSLLLSLASADERSRLRAIQESGVLDEGSLSFARSLLEKYDVRSLVRSQADVLFAAAESFIDALSVGDKAFLGSLLRFVLERDA